jgi:Fe-S cluster assembly protein SufD
MVADTRTNFLDSLRAERPARPSGVAWLDRLRSNALERANALSVPSTRDEEWRFTDLRALTRLPFQPMDSAPALAQEALSAWVLPHAHARLVFVDGLFAPDLSMQPQPSPGSEVCTLHAALRTRAEGLEEHLGVAAAYENELFVALNTAFLRDAVVITLGGECSLPGPVHVLHIATERDEAHALYPRTLLVAGAGSRCTLVEDYVALGKPTYFSAPVTEIVLGANATVQHIRLQREGLEAFHFATCAVKQASGSRYESVSLALGGRIARLDHDIVHAEPGCETELSGLMLVGRRQLADTHSFADHAKAQGRLRQVQKCVVGTGGHAVFNGKVLVREGAQHTDAGQSFRGLLLSDRARIDAKPQLEIFADDVKCAHGAAIGQLDPDELFYLRSRGFSEADARNLLTYAFAAEIVERIPLRDLATTLAQTVAARIEENS